MTRRDYIILAEAFRTTRTLVATDEMVRGVDAVLEAVCIALKRDNERFNKQHFVAVAKGERNLNSRPTRKHSRKLCGYCGQVEDTPEHQASNCAAHQRGKEAVLRQIKEKYETPKCTCSERSWFGKEHDEACPLNPRIKAVR